MWVESRRENMTRRASLTRFHVIGHVTTVATKLFEQIHFRYHIQNTWHILSQVNSKFLDCFFATKHDSPHTT